MISHLRQDGQLNLAPVPGILERAVVENEKCDCRLVEPEIVKEASLDVTYFRYYGRSSSLLSGTLTG